MMPGNDDEKKGQMMWRKGQMRRRTDEMMKRDEGKQHGTGRNDTEEEG